MSELEKDFGSFRGEHGPTSSSSGEVHRPTSSPSREDMTRLRALPGRTWPDFGSFRGRTSPGFESFRAGLDAYVAHRNARSRQVKLKGPTPEEFRSQSLVAQSLFKPSQFYREPCFLNGKRSESSGPAEPVLGWADSVQASLGAHIAIPVDMLLQIPLEDIGAVFLPIVVKLGLDHREGVLGPRVVEAIYSCGSSSWAICTALSAAPLRIWSATTHMARPCLTVGSRRMRPT